MVYGCHIRDASRNARASFSPRFSARFKGSAAVRAKRRGLALNAEVVLGNVSTSEDVPLLEAAHGHDEPLVRVHAAWAAGTRRAPQRALEDRRQRTQRRDVHGDDQTRRSR